MEGEDATGVVASPPPSRLSRRSSTRGHYSNKEDEGPGTDLTTRRSSTRVREKHRRELSKEPEPSTATAWNGTFEDVAPMSSTEGGVDDGPKMSQETVKSTDADVAEEPGEVNEPGGVWTASIPFGTKFHKFFSGHGWFEGHVTSYRTFKSGNDEEDDGVVIYKIFYPEDEDEEEMNENDLKKAMLRSRNKNSKPAEARNSDVISSPKAQKQSQRRSLKRKSRSVVTADSDDDEDYVDFEEDESDEIASSEDAESYINLDEDDDDDDDFLPATGSGTPTKQQQKKKRKSVVTPSPKTKKAKARTGSTGQGVPKKKEETTLSARSIAKFGLPRGALARHVTSGIVVRSLVGIVPLVDDGGTRRKGRVLFPVDSSVTTETTGTTTQSHLPGRLMVVDPGHHDLCPKEFVGRIFESGGDLQNELTKLCPPIGRDFGSEYILCISYETMVAVADPKFTTFSFAKARLDAAGLLPNEENADFDDDEERPYIVRVTWDGIKHNTIEGSVDWYPNTKAKEEELVCDDSLVWGVLESRQKGLPAVLVGVSTGLINYQDFAVDPTDDTPLNVVQSSDSDLNVNSGSSGDQLLPHPTKKMADVQLPASLAQKAIRRSCPVPLVESAIDLLKGTSHPGATLAFLNALWKGAIVDASPFHGDECCLGVSTLVLLALVSAVDPAWKLPKSLTRAVVASAIRMTGTSSNHWMGHVVNDEDWFVLEHHPSQLKEKEVQAMKTRNIFRAAQVAIGDRMSWGKWNKFEGDSSAAAILSYLNFEDWEGSIFQDAPAPLENELELLQAFEKGAKVTSTDTRACNLDKECRLAAIEPSIMPYSLVLLQAILRQPPTKWKKHSLPSLSRSVRKLITEANPRVKEQMLLTRAATWGKEGIDQSRRSSPGPTTVHDYESFREVVTITGSLSTQEIELMDSFEAIQECYQQLLSKKKSEDIVFKQNCQDTRTAEKELLVPQQFVSPVQDINEYVGRCAFLLLFGAAIEVTACGETVSAMFAGNKDTPLLIQRIGKARIEGRELATAGGSASGATAVPSLGYVQPNRSDEERELYLEAEKEVARYWKGGRDLSLSNCCEGHQWINFPELKKWRGWGDELIVHRTAEFLDDRTWRFAVAGKQIDPFDARPVISSCSIDATDKTCLTPLSNRQDIRQLLNVLLYISEEESSKQAPFPHGKVVLEALLDAHSFADLDRSNEGLMYDWLPLARQSMIPSRTWRDALLAIRMREKDHVVLGSGIQPDGNGAPRDMAEGVLVRIFAAMEALYPTALKKESAFRYRVRSTGAAFHNLLACLEILGRGNEIYECEVGAPALPMEASLTTSAKETASRKRKKDISLSPSEEAPVNGRRRTQRHAAKVAKENVKMIMCEEDTNLAQQDDKNEIVSESNDNSNIDNHVPLPIIKTKLWGHQAKSVNTVVTGIKQGKRGFADASAVGSGKSLTALATIVQIQKMMEDTGQRRHGALIMLPTPSLMKEWLLETALHTANFHVIEQREDGSLFSLTYGKSYPPIDGCALVISTLDRVAAHPFIRQTAWDFVVVDECLSVQNASAKRTPSAWRQIEISSYGCLLLSATFFRSKFDQLFYMIRMLRSPLPRSMEWLPATIHEHIVCCIPESERKWVMKPEPVSLPQNELKDYRKIIDAFGRKRLNKSGDIDGRLLWSDLESFLRQFYEGRSKKNVYDSSSTMGNAFVKICSKLLKQKRRPLIFANTMIEANFLLQVLADAGIDAKSWQSVSSERLLTRGPSTTNNVIVAVKTTQGQGLNMQHHADAIICRPTPGDLLEQMKGRIDRPGQTTKELLLFCVFAEHTIEEAQYANIHLVGSFFRQFIAPVASKYRERIDMEAVITAGGTKKLVSGTVRKRWHDLLESAGTTGTFASINSTMPNDDENCSKTGSATRKKKATKSQCGDVKASKTDKIATKYAPLNKVKRNRADPVAVRQQKELARSGKASVAVRNWLFEKRKNKSTNPDKGLPFKSMERFSDTKPPAVLEPPTISKALDHLSMNDPKLAMLIERIGKKSIELSVGKIMAPTQARFFDKCVRAITFTMVSLDAGNAFLRRLAIKIGVCIERLGSARKKRVLDETLKMLKESGCDVKDSDDIMERLTEGRHRDVLFSHNLVGELIGTCDVVNGKRLGHPHLCGITHPCGKNDDHRDFLDKARQSTDERSVSAGFSIAKAGFIISLVDDFRSGRLSGDMIQKASDREAAKILMGIKGIGDWTAGMILLNFLGRADIMMYGDLTIRNGLNDIYDISHYDGDTLLESAADFPDNRENRNLIDALAKENKWYGYRSVVGYLMWYLQEQGDFLLI